jgi:hypothetical protein
MSRFASIIAFALAVTFLIVSVGHCATPDSKDQAVAAAAAKNLVVKKEPFSAKLRFTRTGARNSKPPVALPDTSKAK